MHTCSEDPCKYIKLLETYKIIEINLLKSIDLLQEQKHSLMKEYEEKLIDLNEKLEKLKISTMTKTDLLKKEVLSFRIQNHELENKLRIAEKNLIINKTIPIEDKRLKLVTFLRNFKVSIQNTLLKFLQLKTINKEKIVFNEVQEVFIPLFKEINKFVENFE